MVGNYDADHRIGGAYGPNVPTITSVVAPPDGTASKLVVTWTAPSADSTHGAATGYGIQYSPHGTGTWSTANVTTSGTTATITGLSGGTSYDVQVRATNASPASPSAWTTSTTASTYGVAIAWGNLVPPTTEPHGVGPGINITAIASPTPVGTQWIAWSASNTVAPSTGLTQLVSDGQSTGMADMLRPPQRSGHISCGRWREPGLPA